MIEDQFLNLFITEEIFQLPEQEQEQKTISAAPAPATHNSAPATEAAKPPTVPQPEPTPPTHALAIWTPPLTTKDRELITKILLAVNEDIRKAFLMEGIGAYQPHFEKLICFGYKKELELKLSASLDLYKPSDLAGKKVLISAEPDTLHSSREDKAKLWSALQEMFLK